MPRQENHTSNQLVIFDFDGVLVDTEYATFQFYADILPSYGITLNKSDFKYKIGRKSIDFFKSVMRDKFNKKLADKLTDEKRAAFQKEPEKYVTPIPGAFNLVKQCHAAGLVLAIGSQNERPMIDATIDKFNIRKYFTVVRSLQDITNKKPNPEIFVNIAKQLKLPPQDAVVIEDAPDGVAAAKAGGFNIIAVTSSARRKDLAGAHLFVQTPVEISADTIMYLNKKSGPKPAVK